MIRRSFKRNKRRIDEINCLVFLVVNKSLIHSSSSSSSSSSNRISSCILYRTITIANKTFSENSN